MKRLNIAIDGYAGCGKSTLARDLAGELNYTLVDTGALYRGLTYFVLDQMDSWQKESIIEVIEEHKPKLAFNEENNHLELNGKDIETQIRSDKQVADHVSELAAIPKVRAYLISVQKAYIQRKGVVMEGRDIGTVVMPDADVKLFLTATLEERINRRFAELEGRGLHPSRDDVSANLSQRDQTDASRSTAPLQKASDAIAIDTTNFNQESQLTAALGLVRPYLKPEEYFRFLQ